MVRTFALIPTLMLSLIPTADGVAASTAPTASGPILQACCCRYLECPPLEYIARNDDGVYRGDAPLPYG